MSTGVCNNCNLQLKPAKTKNRKRLRRTYIEQSIDEFECTNITLDEEIDDEDGYLRAMMAEFPFNPKAFEEQQQEEDEEWAVVPVIFHNLKRCVARANLTKVGCCYRV